MKIALHLLILCCICSLNAQTVRDASVELSATVQSDPPQITLYWTANTNAFEHIIFRKLKSGSAWNPTLATLSGSATSFTDTTVTPGVSYEYRVFRLAQTFSGHGYINAGINIPPIEHRGTLLLVIDDTMAEPLAAEIETLTNDLTGDGWYVREIIAPRTASPAEIKSQIVAAYQMDPVHTRAVYLLGHVPVPYSGNFNLDGHPDHTGAWPADVYYGEMNGSWTDASVSNVTANDPRNRNIPGDGKFDQTLIPNDVELQVGRVDFANMPAFATPETELLRNYLNKAHGYRHKMWSAEYRALIDDNFGYFGGETFASSGWKAAAPLVGIGNTTDGDYFSGMADESYLWSYGCGGGTYTSAGGIGTTANFAASDLQTVFTMLFGSYFGDWDSQNNFLRAPLAQGRTLTNAWSGRPHWVFHHMGLGEPIGYSTRISQNNNGLYFASLGARYVSIALMGDPALRNHVVASPGEITATLDGIQVDLEWKASADDEIMGYHVYRKAEGDQVFVRLHGAPVQEQSYTDHCLITPGTYHYMVRALKHENTPSGTYYNLSQGMMSTIGQNEDHRVTAGATAEVDGSMVSFLNASVNATMYAWDFGDGSTSDLASPEHTFADGEYLVTLIASNACDADTFYIPLSIETSSSVTPGSSNGIAAIYPNPSRGSLMIDLYEVAATRIDVFTTTGALVRSVMAGNETIVMNDLHPGIYLFVLRNDNSVSVHRVIVLFGK